LFIIVPLLDIEVIVEKTGLPVRLMHREHDRQMVLRQTRPLPLGRPEECTTKHHGLDRFSERRRQLPKVP
jgi:hypothetical protein